VNIHDFYKQIKKSSVFINLIAHWKITLIVTAALIAIIFNFYHNFPLNSFLDTGFIVQIALPVIVIVFVLKEKVSDYGLGFGNVKRGLMLSLAFFLFCAPVIVFLLASSDFKRYYLPQLNNLSSTEAWVAQGIKDFLCIFKGEFILRGFLLFGLRNVLGNFFAVLIQIIPYVLLHLGKPELECYGSIVFGFALGYLALYTRSIWYGAILHWSIACAFNIAIFWMAK
jgi:membrane protease YdiL (CAAX protease family)